ncbi:dual specificity protein kinase pom1 [Niveomyces insectorum RCEF 264]|uniref:dual-specificity kinase n=1 Tax=Niveomyces insectorum RCEF 264 TaxID=1081102 RepID=A0A167MDR1_9HYPO|nr:dual specificity protein kinase pom1 [Niveomyces insectorum RCEF 264]
MLKDHIIQTDAQPADRSPTRSAFSDKPSPMLSASSSNNHSLFSFGRSNGAGGALATNHSTSTLSLTNRSGHGSNDSHDNHDNHNNYDDNDDDEDDDGVADHTTGFDFLPSVSFDDLQSSLESASTEFKLAQFPSPSGQGSILGPQGRVDKMAVHAAGGSAHAGNGVALGVAMSGAESRSTTNFMSTTGAARSSATTASSTTATTRTAIPQSSSTSTLGPAGKTAKSGGSILRRPSITTRHGNVVSSSSSSSAVPDASSAPASTRQRRQSHYPPVSNSNISSNIGKPPRKSVGPGILDSEYGSGVGRSTSRRRPSLASNSDRPLPGSARSSIDGGSRMGIGSNEGPRNVNGSRASKTRSFQHSTSRASISGAGLEPPRIAGSAIHRPPRATANNGNANNAAASTNGAYSSVVGNGLSSNTNSNGNGNGNGNNNKSTAAGKRMSLAPSALHASHATGLGARTVSPTDTRRMKRMSIMPPGNSNSSTNNASATSSNNSSATNSRDVTQTSNVPLPFSSEVRASSRSPSMLPRKTSTPSSSRTTPDPNRKSYSSGFSIGSSMSFNTVRSSTGSIQPRLSQGGGGGNASGVSTAGSRLPAPKVLNLHNNAPTLDDDEDVPPVPAIPKLFEPPPKDWSTDLPFLDKRKPNPVFDGGSTHSSSTASLSGSGGPASALEPPAKIVRKHSTRAPMDPDKANHTVNGVPLPASSNSKKNLQPLRLPPINLMPLSTPTAAKIAALQEHNNMAMSDRNLSPPPSRIIAKTPTTPMTASKGAFFSRHRNEDRADLPVTLRSSSSIYHHHQHARTGSASGSGGDTTSSSEFSAAAMPIKASSFHKPSMSPFLSSSAPKNSGPEPGYFKVPKTPRDDGDDGFVSVSSTTPALPSILPSPSMASMRRPSGPRAPAPTPSRSFAPLESASTIVSSADLATMPNDAALYGASAAAAVPKSPPPLSSPDEPPTPSSIGSSLRRKLSMSWKRSNSKSSLSMQPGSTLDKPTDATSSSDQQQPQQQQPHHHRRQSSLNAKHDGMPPPPRIPISSTLAQLPSARKSPTPSITASTRTSGTYLESRRRKSSASSLNAVLAQDKNKTDSWISNDRNQKKDVFVKPTGLDGIGGSSSIQAHNASVVHKILKTKASSSSMRHHHHDMWAVDLDTDDLIAEEEMRKLGSRRKETELAARTLDALRRRATPKERVSSQEATRIAMLNVFERGEIVDYNDIYFCGTQNAAKVPGNPKADTPNFGYDDERGDYTIVPGDHLAYRYEIIDLLGKGSFGQVVRCIDHKTGSLVAVKIIRNKKRFHQQALVEVSILQKLREWYQDPKNKHSMVNFTHSFYFRDHLCISTELLDMNLYEFIKANSFRGFSLKLIRRFTKQILGSLILLKQHKVIHCDLKPENILLRHPLHSELRVIDFGSSCFENEKVYTYIQSRFYRSPEVILGMTYGMPIDMWSLGCILAELYTGVPIFPGENEQEQLACIMEVFGPPEKHLIEKSTRKKLFFDSMGKPRLTVSSKGRRRRPSSKTLQQVIKCDDDAFLDFLSRCLRWDPDRRLKPDDALRHEFVTGQKSVLPPPLLRGSHSNLHNGRDNSPVRRHHTISMPSGSNINGGNGPRPLPEPPGTATAGHSGFVKPGPPPSLRAGGGGGGARESMGASAHKSAINSGGVTGAASSVTSASRRSSAVSSSTASLSLGKRISAGLGPGGAANGVGMGIGGGINGTGPASNLPRAAGRVVSGGGLMGSGGGGMKPDLAAAGAAAAMTRRA